MIPLSSILSGGMSLIASLIGKAVGLFFVWRLGKKTNELKTAEEALEYAREGKKIEDSVNSMPDGAALDELRKDYSR